MIRLSASKIKIESDGIYVSEITYVDFEMDDKRYDVFCQDLKVTHDEIIQVYQK